MEAATVSEEGGQDVGVRVASEPDRQTLLATLTRAFAADPVVRWVFPVDDTFQRAFPDLASAFGGGAIGHGAAYLAPGNAGAALWLPPGEVPDDNGMKNVLVDYVSPGRLDLIQEFFDRLEPYHPEDSCWYLTLIGVSPDRQGEGHGSALLAHALRRCDEAHMPVFLEATSERNAALYARHGFEIIGEVQVEDSPTIRPMLRPAQ